jgi:hypothetical protein
MERALLFRRSRLDEAPPPLRFFYVHAPENLLCGDQFSAWWTLIFIVRRETAGSAGKAVEV